MSKNIVRTYSYSEGPFIVTLNELEDGSLIEEKERVYNYRRRGAENKRKKPYYEKPLEKYSKYNEQIRITDCYWDFAD